MRFKNAGDECLNPSESTEESGAPEGGMSISNAGEEGGLEKEALYIDPELPGGDAMSVEFEGIEVFRITPEGRIFWRGREVESDDDFRAAMLGLASTLKAIMNLHVAAE